jgi:hypothetical protein
MRKSERDRKKGQLLERLPPGKWNFDDAGVGDKEDVINTPGKPSDRLMMMIVAWYKTARSLSSTPSVQGGHVAAKQPPRRRSIRWAGIGPEGEASRGTNPKGRAKLGTGEKI